jgi:hypothetical protein
MKEKTTKKRAKLGRKPIKIEAEEIYDLAKSGLGIMDICRLCNKGKGIGWDLFKRLRDDKNTGIADALERGMSESVKFVNYKLMESINDGSVQSIQFFLRNRRPEEWNHDNKSTVEHTIDLASIISDRRSALSHSTGTLPPTKGLIINNDD